MSEKDMSTIANLLNERLKATDMKINDLSKYIKVEMKEIEGELKNDLEKIDKRMGKIEEINRYCPINDVVLEQKRIKSILGWTYNNSTLLRTVIAVLAFFFGMAVSFFAALSYIASL